MTIYTETVKFFTIRLACAMYILDRNFVCSPSYTLEERNTINDYVSTEKFYPETVGQAS